jgi:hypothetical protein
LGWVLSGWLVLWFCSLLAAGSQREEMRVCLLVGNTILHWCQLFKLFAPHEYKEKLARFAFEFAEFHRQTEKIKLLEREKPLQSSLHY